MRFGPTLLAATLFAILPLAVPALAQTPNPHAGMSMSPADAGMMESMGKMNRDMSSVPMTGDPDHDFVAMMIPHHQGAIDMAQFELQHGKDPELRKLAREIVAAQDKEIALMRNWFAKHQAQRQAKPARR